MTSTYLENLAPEHAQGSAVERARAALAAAQAASTDLVSSYNGTATTEYGLPLQALRDAQVASGQATLAVAEAIAELTSTLRTQVCAELIDLRTEVCGELSELYTEVSETRAAVDVLTDATAESVVAELRDIAGALCSLADRADRPRWWQWRRRRAFRRVVDEVWAAETGEEVSAS
ncbi:hypothetical protein [Actinomadura sp. 6N118]|uniref:hypothetical protein n=1 Tax=Actinomadura sp. 6N118 TaxID=3375151 RepID=UPI0037B48296